MRDQVIAAVFGRAVTDAFFVAFLIPNMLRQLLAEGAVQNAILPVLTEVREREGDAAARRFFRAVRGLSLTLLVIVSALGVVFAPELVTLFAGGYRDDRVSSSSPSSSRAGSSRTSSSWAPPRSASPR